MLLLFALGVVQLAQVPVREQKHLFLHSQNSQCAGLIPPGFRADQLAFYKVHPGSSQPWVRTSAPAVVMAMVCSK